MESIFDEPAEIPWQAGEEGSWDALLAPVRRRRAGGRDGLMEATEIQRAEKAMREQGEGGRIGKRLYF